MNYRFINIRRDIMSGGIGIARGGGFINTIRNNQRWRVLPAPTTPLTIQDQKPGHGIINVICVGDIVRCRVPTQDDVRFF